jgi:uncharacterized lipoprotein NlpE involved in copper resistance
MYKVIFLVGIAIATFALISCKESPKSRQTSTEPATTVNSPVPDGHNSSNSLDVEGSYKGTLPCADCEGIETEIMLGKDKSYVKRTVYLGKDGKVIEETGYYSWNNEGNIITLSGSKDAPNQYFVGENKLIQLDMKGNRITGELADKYVLQK